MFKIRLSIIYLCNWIFIIIILTLKPEVTYINTLCNDSHNKVIIFKSGRPKYSSWKID